jgi:Ala-tRNA(Pro) deacylase
MQARQSKPAQIFHGARQAGVKTNDTLDETLLKLGQSLAAASACVPLAKTANLQILANIGVQYSSLQRDVAKHIQELSAVDVASCLVRLEQHLSSNASPYLTGDALSPTDCTLLTASASVLTLLYSIRPYPAVAQWFAGITSQPWCIAVLGEQRALGTTRIGGQIDLRPDPINAYSHAMRSIRANKGSKKKETQRQKEKKQKKKDHHHQQQHTESKTANPMDPSDTTVLPFLLGPRVEVAAGKAKRMKTLAETLTRIGLSTTTESHPATKTVADLMRETAHLPGGHCKNLFVKGKKKSKTRANDSKIWLICALHDTAIDMKKLSKSLGYKDAMRMGNGDLLNDTLAVVQGEVSPFALTNNSARDVQLVLDSKMMEEKTLWFHPLSMEASTSISPNDLLAFVTASGRTPEIVDFSAL